MIPKGKRAVKMKISSTVAKGTLSALRLGGAVALAFAVTACGATYRNHGYVPPREDLDQIAVGVDTLASVEETLGSSSSGSVLDDNALYFVRTRIRDFALLEPEVVERQVVAISFDASGVVSNIESFGLEQGQVVPLARRVTDSSVAGKSFLRQLFGNIGRFTPGGIDN